MKIFIALVGPSKYSVELDNGEQLLKSTRLPFFDGARALAARGLSGPFEMWDREWPYPRMRGIIEKAAKLSVKEGPLRYVPYEAASEPASEEN